MRPPLSYYMNIFNKLFDTLVWIETINIIYLMIKNCMIITLKCKFHIVLYDTIMIFIMEYLY